MTNALAITGAMLPSPGEWATMEAMATTAFRSRMLPAHIKDEQAALFIMMKGRELGVPTTYALSNIVVINGKPTANAELMLALIYRDHGDNAVQFVETTPETCMISYARRGWATRRQHTFTIVEARAAGLIKAGPWSQYPAAMLRARCVSAVARLAFPDSIAGLYLADEMGATVNAEGEIESVPEPERVAATAQPARTEPPREQTQRRPRFNDPLNPAFAARIREIAPAKGLDLPNKGPIIWNAVINFVRDSGGAVAVSDDGLDPAEVGRALLALPDVDEYGEGSTDERDDAAPVDVAIARDTAGDETWDDTAAE